MVVYEFTPLEIMPHSVSSPAIAGLEFVTGLTALIQSWGVSS